MPSSPNGIGTSVAAGVPGWIERKRERMPCKCLRTAPLYTNWLISAACTNVPTVQVSTSAFVSPDATYKTSFNIRKKVERTSSYTCVSALILLLYT